MHLYNLPPEIVQSLTARHLVAHVPDNDQPNVEPLPTVVAGSKTCATCLGLLFHDVDEQRSHFRSDWHRYNVKTKLHGGTAVAEADFAKLVDSIDDSLSGSESSEENLSEEDSDAVATLVNRRKQTRASRSPSPSHISRPQTPLLWFHSADPPPTQIGVYRILFPTDSQPLDTLKEFQTRKARTWALFMVAGGHFAGAIVRVSREEREESTAKKPKRPQPELEVLLHKTFHRYTTRRKQGGSQSVNDNAKGNAKSAGATLRRYGEQALRDDIHGLLSQWSEELAECSHIFIRANVSNRKIFLDFDPNVLTKADPRLRTFPFPTRRPTQSELMRCLLELTQVKVSHFTEEELRAQDDAFLASIKPKVAPRPPPLTQIQQAFKPELPELSKDQEVSRDKWQRAIDMTMKGRLESLKSFLEREQDAIADLIPSWAISEKGHTRMVTLLQVASSAGQDEVVRWLLEDHHADPTVSVVRADEAETLHVKAYDLAPGRSTREIFQRAAAADPQRWKWLEDAHVPLLEEGDIDKRDDKRREKKRLWKERVKQRDRDQSRDASASETEAAPQPPPLLKTSTVSGVAGLTPEMRMKIERERRARAAEARLNRG